MPQEGRWQAIRAPIALRVVLWVDPAEKSCSQARYGLSYCPFRMFPAPSNAPSSCPHCGHALAEAKWSILHGQGGPVPFTQCPSCQAILEVPPEPSHEPAA